MDEPVWEPIPGGAGVRWLCATMADGTEVYAVVQPYSGERRWRASAWAYSPEDAPGGLPLECATEPSIRVGDEQGARCWAAAEARAIVAWFRAAGAS